MLASARSCVSPVAREARLAIPVQAQKRNTTLQDQTGRLLRRARNHGRTLESQGAGFRGCERRLSRPEGRTTRVHSARRLAPAELPGKRAAERDRAALRMRLSFRRRTDSAGGRYAGEFRGSLIGHRVVPSSPLVETRRPGVIRTVPPATPVE